MVLYHGTNQIIHTIDLSKSNLRTDFGKGFYMGSNLGIARDWAKSRAGFSGAPVVMRYVLNAGAFDNRSLNVCKYESANIDWLNFVRDNRRRNDTGVETPEPRHSFDIVSGAIANDKVNFVVDDYMKGLISAAEAVKKIRVIPSVIQVSLHTARALSFLNTVSAQYQEMLKNGKWSDWKG